MWPSKYLRDKYNRLEILFFLAYYILFSIFSSLEYNFLERKNLTLSLNDLPSQLLFGIKALLPGIVFYKLLIQRYLFNKKYLAFFGGIIIYLVLLNFYSSYGNLLVSKLTFLPKSITTQAARWYSSDAVLRFSVIYMLREFLVLTALAYFIRSARQEQHIHQLSGEKLRSELVSLKAQIQPHFFFNTLNNIYALSLQGSVKAAPLVARHADIMRYILDSSALATVPLQSEVSFLKNYTEVEAIRYHSSKLISFISQGIQESAIIEPLLLLPFIENTFKHGLLEEIDEGFIQIIISQVGQELSVEVSNSKPAGPVVVSTSGTGLVNVRKRLELLYPGRYTLLINEQVNTYTVSLTIAIRTT